ncbi:MULTISPECIES: alpha/beta hydrolase [Amycolatopsis]|uniref:Acetyl esterase n=1 Tax=Amycolatopsis echigonensis TaxID=2576905 RepID=A0A2N3WNS6_9PSEU|nr:MULTISPECIES: alpha/beta hydrolase [Amycolatopsis]PKV95515.1 acetyl esterase [Amycolatopsis niigatensis]
MPLDPFAESLLLSLEPLPEQIDFPAFRAKEAAQAAALAQQLAQPGPPIKERREVTIPVDGGTVDLVIHRPIADTRLPAHLYLHGGGWIGGSAKNPFIDILGQERAAGAGCVVIAVDYRKAPEHKYPTELNDCYAALLWTAEHAEEIGIRPDLITVGGGSAGANLAAALTLKVRDEGGPRIAFQLLEVPCVDLTGSLPSHRSNGTGYGLTTADITRLLDYYLPSPEEINAPYVSPLLAPDLSGLPPAHIMSAEYDPLRDDGEAYAQRLNDAGVPATFTLGRGHIHISPPFTKTMASARAWRDEAVAVLRQAHRSHSS